MPLVVRLRPAGTWIVCGIVFALVLTGCSGHDSARDALTVTVSRGNCGTGWKSPHSGPQTVQVSNVGTVTTEVDLIDPGTGGVYAEVEALAPNTTRPMRLTFGQATYAFRCLAEDTDAVTGPAIQVTDGPPPSAPAVLPISNQDLTGAVTAYRGYVTKGLATLAGNVATLVRTLRGGDRAASRSAWLTAHLAYERLGAAYDTFGDFADQIDGMPDGLPAGVTGSRLHRVAADRVRPVARRVARLAGADRRPARQRRRRPSRGPPEGADRPERPAAARPRNHGERHAVRADRPGRPGQRYRARHDRGEPGRYPGGAERARTADDQAVLRLAAGGHLDREHPCPGCQGQRSDGTWIAPTALDPQTHERLDAAVGQLVEVLAPIAAIGDVRRTS